MAFRFGAAESHQIVNCADSAQMRRMVDSRPWWARRHPRRIAAAPCGRVGTSGRLTRRRVRGTTWVAWRTAAAPATAAGGRWPESTDRKTNGPSFGGWATCQQIRHVSVGKNRRPISFVYYYCVLFFSQRIWLSSAEGNREAKRPQAFFVTQQKVENGFSGYD